MQSRNRDIDIENKCIPKGEEGGMNWEAGTDIDTLLILYIKHINNENIL